MVGMGSGWVEDAGRLNHGQRRRYLAIYSLVALFGISCSENPASPDGITLSIPSTPLEIGGTIQLIATAKSAEEFAWVSSNPAVAAVNQSGVVTGVAAGIATITVSAGGNTASSPLIVEFPTPAGSEVLFAAGDIATCTNDFDEATAKILDAHPNGTVAALGDNAYESGSAAEYANCYHPTWGRHFSRTMPTPGNHEYLTPNAAGYYGYFGAKAGDPTKGYYSYDLGAWHIVVLNSNIPHDANSAQIEWLRLDLEANRGKVCTLAYSHHPRFSSGTHGNDLREAAIWETLYAYGVDIVLNGHEHSYERFAPQTPAGVADNERGLRELVVGTGGTILRTLGTMKPNSEVFNAASHGVLKLTLSPNGYAWQFLPVAGQTFTDSGLGSCH